MLDTMFQTPEGQLVAAADLSIGANILDHQRTIRTVMWCRKLAKRKRLLVDLYAKPLTVTSSHRVLVPGGEVEAKKLSQNDDVLMGTGCHQLLKVIKRHKNIEAMELEFAGDAIVEVHAPSILTKGSDPSLPIDQDGAFKCKKEVDDDSSMAVDTMEPGVGSTSTDNPTDGADLPEQSESWPDTDDDVQWR